MEQAPVLFTEIPGKDGKLGVLTLNRPAVLNALNYDMLKLLQKHLTSCAENPEIKAVIVRAAEGRAFCAGGDLRLAYQQKMTQDPQFLQFFLDEYRLNRYIYHYPKPYIALLDGITMGGGLGISIHGSHRLGTDNLVLAMPETAIGFFPDVGGSYVLSRLPGQLGICAGLLGTPLSSADCLALQLIDFNISSESIPAIITALAEANLGDKPRAAVTQVLAQFQKPVKSTTLNNYQSFIDKYFAKESIEEIIAALAADANPWCQEMVTLFHKKSPTSLKVTLKLLRMALNLDFDRCMDLEEILAIHLLQGHDFYEGIRALIIDKDNKPQWQPHTLAEVSQAMVDGYFLPAVGAAGGRPD